jgi:biopolymer transport protein ExbB
MHAAGPVQRSTCSLVRTAGVLLLTLVPHCTEAQGSTQPQHVALTAEEPSIVYFLFGGGGVAGIACTLPILCMSVVALSMLIELMITVRRCVLIPHGLADEVHGHIEGGSFPYAEQLCKLRPSLLAAIILAGLQEVRRGFRAVEKAMEDALQAQAARMLRKIELLSLAGNISTMLGLFGTVVGLMVAFKRVADTQGVARAADLAGGIYLALMTTIEGLAVAIPALVAHAFFKHRAEQLIAEAAALAEFAFQGYKRDRTARRSAKIKQSATPTSGS